VPRLEPLASFAAHACAMSCSNSRLRHYNFRLSTISIKIRDILADHDRKSAPRRKSDASFVFNHRRFSVSDKSERQSMITNPCSAQHQLCYIICGTMLRSVLGLGGGGGPEIQRHRGIAHHCCFVFEDCVYRDPSLIYPIMTMHVGCCLW
jgi:hypothetical protein